jgi:hypothetical protein
METALNKMTDDQRDHLRIVISELIQCYLDDDLHGMVLIGKEPFERFKVMAVNTNEMDAVKLLGTVNDYVQESVMDDAPPKELFN